MISAPDFITRDTRSTATKVDLFPTTAFDVEFYRQIARGSVDGPPDRLYVLPFAPNFYMEVEGVKGFSKETAVRLEAIARKLVPIMTGGKFQVTTWITGPTPRTPESGWVVIERTNLPSGVCGTVGDSGIGAFVGHILLDSNDRCRLDPVFAHELGHAMGFFHVDRVGSMMYPTQLSKLAAADQPTEAEARAMAFAYARPRGNRDVDVDP